MASRPDHMSSKSRPIPLALPTALLSKLDKTAALMNRTRAQLIRDTIEIGLEDLRRCGYNIAAAVVDKAHSTAPLESLPLPKVAEDSSTDPVPDRYPADYAKKKKPGQP